MYFKTYLISYFIALLVISSISTIIYVNPLLVNKEDLLPINRQLLVVYNKIFGEIFFADYLIYRVSPVDPDIYSFKIFLSFICKNRSFFNMFLKNLVIMTAFSRSYPVILPKNMLEYNEYYELFENRYVFSLMKTGVNNHSGVFYRVSTGYLIVVIKYYVNPYVLIDVSKYVPPIIYYPEKPPQPDFLKNIVDQAFNKPLYASIILYAFKNIVDKNTVFSIDLRYFLSFEKLHIDYLVYGWIILFVLVEIYEPRTIIIVVKTLFYRVQVLSKQILRGLKKLKQYIGGLSRV